MILCLPRALDDKVARVNGCDSGIYRVTPFINVAVILGEQQNSVTAAARAPVLTGTVTEKSLGVGHTS